MTLRIIAEKNAARLGRLGYETFDQAFRALNNQKDFDAYVAQAFSLDTISSDLEDNRIEFFVAFQGDEPVGYFKLYAGTAPECVSPRPALELARLYTLKSQWGKGVGASMMEEALGRARGKGFAVMWLSSWKENHRGNAFYRKYGFNVAGQQTFTIGNDVQHDYILSRVL